MKTMQPILEPVNESTDDPVVAPIFAYLRERAPNVPYLFRTLAHAPHLLKGWTEFAWPMRTNSTSPRTTRELAILRVLQLADADNEFEFHKRMGLNAGLQQSQIDELGAWRTSEAYSPSERAVLAVAEEIAAGPAASEASMGELRKHFGAGEIVELTLTACFYVLVARFTTSLGMAHDDPSIISAIGKV